MFGSVHLYFVIGYLLLLVVVGLILAKREVKTSDDFVVAGRKLPLFVLIGTLLATWIGSGTITGAANFIYTRGPLAGILYFIGAPLGIVILYFIANKVRDLAKYTIPQILETKYGSLARTISSICIILAYVGIISYQFKGGGYVLNLTTGMELETGVLVSAVVIILLAVTGGMVTIAYSDFISALLIVTAMGIGLPFVLSNVGGWSSLFDALPKEKTTWSGGLSGMQLLGYILPLIFLLLGDQNMFQRFGSAKDAATARKSNIGFLLGELVIMFLTITFASAAILLFPEIKADTAILQVAMGGVPVVVGGFILAAAVAFMVTTGDSFLLSAATNVTYDLWLRYVKPDASEEEKLKYTRIFIVVLGILAYVIGQYFPSILAMQMYSYTMYGAAITPAFLGALLWKRASKFAGLASILVGGGMTLIWEIVLHKPMGWNAILISAPLSILALVVFSYLVPNKSNSKEKVKEIV
ncbi:sodium:solute symporter family protein [Acidaminobacter sp. JC074]|uniref:sodium:solute symporter family protein n=1 Tax=Acidaminobacter sp. JC074 TaxID=2530199 RepID=UPI001F0EFEC8|nr:sodium:solute symporter family protein [Acidaminobacter sp. JC074]